jgi:hypothetical protein
MKMTDKGLDPDNKYIGPHIGGEEQYWNFGTIGGDGNFIIGLRVKIATDVKWAGAVGALSLVTLTTQEAAATTESKSPGLKK